MISIETERRLLQVATALACLVPLGMGGISVANGAIVLRGVAAPVPIDLDSHFRYLSGLLLGLGVVFLVSIPWIERMTLLFRGLAVMVVIGGLARLLSLVEDGVPSSGHQFGLVMELVVVPLIVLWQGRIAKRYGKAT